MYDSVGCLDIFSSLAILDRLIQSPRCSKTYGLATVLSSLLHILLFAFVLIFSSNFPFSIRIGISVNTLPSIVLYIYLMVGRHLLPKKEFFEAEEIDVDIRVTHDGRDDCFEASSKRRKLYQAINKCHPDKTTHY